MKQHEMFAGAQWVCAGEYALRNPDRPDPSGLPHFPILRGHFTAENVKKATVRVIGFGFFHCYINGKEITDDQFLPLSSDFEPRKNCPSGEIVTDHRIYVPEYDVTDLVRTGENVIAVWFGGGWYTFGREGYGSPKAIWRLTVEHDDGTVTDVCSSTRDRIGDSPVKTYNFANFNSFESRDDNGFDFAALGADFDDSAWAFAKPAPIPETRYYFTDCPPDRTERVLPVTVIRDEDGKQTYDGGLNVSGYPILRVFGKPGDVVTVRVSEERNEDGSISEPYNFGSFFRYVCDGTDRTVTPMFQWYAFRYFSVEGPAFASGVRVVRSDVPVTAEFDCDNEIINWFYEAYINTQKNNMHAGIPSDCPHIERRGYTGDGELTCHAAMDILDARAFYRKWIDDISDCQDTMTGHVQYTAPYLQSGGGPGAGGCAIVEVPYMYWKHYGDAEPMTRMYKQMRRYFDYLEEHSVNDLVVSDKPGEWCLGDWCAPDAVALPAPFVNNYYYVKSLMRMKEIAAVIGKTSDIPEYDEKIAARKAAITAAYFNTWDGNFIAGIQGANAFAVDIGLGDGRTYPNMVNYYKRLGHFDTGICGTDLVTRVLFEHGDADLAVSLLASEHPVSFDGMRKAGATTIWENWPHAVWERSHDHPMFGSPAAYLFDFLLGIGQPSDGAGYETLIIKPSLTTRLDHVSGSRTLPCGKVSASYERKDGRVEAKITIPEGVRSVFVLDGEEKSLNAGENVFTIA